MIALGTQDPSKVRSLQDFLAAIPHAKHRQEILLDAVLHYVGIEDVGIESRAAEGTGVETVTSVASVASGASSPRSPEGPQDESQTTLDWILQNQSILYPDLNLSQWAKRRALELLMAADPQAKPNLQEKPVSVQFSQFDQSCLRSHCHPSEFLLIRKLLDIEENP